MTKETYYFQPNPKRRDQDQEAVLTAGGLSPGGELHSVPAEDENRGPRRELDWTKRRRRPVSSGLAAAETPQATGSRPPANKVRASHAIKQLCYLTNLRRKECLAMDETQWRCQHLQRSVL